MLILSNGYKLPETGDFGSIWFPAIEDNIQRLNDHSHDGIDSNKLSASSITSVVTTVASGDFILQSPGLYRALITFPATMLVDSSNVTFRDLVTKEKVYLNTERFSATQVYVYTSFQDSFEALFTS